MNNSERIVPTVWISNWQEVNTLMPIFREQGIKRLRVNCTRHSADGYIKEIEDFQKIWGEAFELILDVPIPRRKVRVFYEWNGHAIEILPSVIYPISRENEQNKRNGGMYVGESDFEKIINIPKGTILTVGEDHATVMVEENNESEILVKGLRKGTVPYGKYITSHEMKFIECNEEFMKEYLEVIETVPCYGVALSFIETAEDVKRIQRMLDEKLRVIAKIETLRGVENLDEIIKVSDEVMIARGDLFINTGYEHFASSCEAISDTCERNKKRYYFATGILESFGADNFKPSRSEICEVYNILKYTNADIILEHSKCRTKRQALEVLGIINRIAR